MRPARQLLRAVVAMAITPGARLSEQEIAGRCGLSRRPVREAPIGVATPGRCAQDFVAELNYEASKDTDPRLYAGTRCREIVSGASQRRPDQWNSRHPPVAWQGTAAAGHLYRHEHDDVAGRRVWQTLAFSRPPLHGLILRPADVDHHARASAGQTG